MKITFLGGGNMATALIGGMRQKGFSAPAIQVVEPIEAARERMTDAFGVRCTAVIDAAAMNCEVWVLSVKPQQMREALAPLAGRLQNQLVISIAAGLRLVDIGRWLGGHRQLVRTMPNTPALIGQGITGLYADPAVDGEGRARAERILGAVGSTIWIPDEEKMDAVTAISGSGPAYVFYFIEAMQEAACALGFDELTARRLSIETVLGAARLAQGSAEPVATLRERVTSKGGTTAAALQSFETDQVKASLLRGIVAADTRGRELGEMMGKD
jgi:pyrroline-5-carboxylate reductase